MIADLVTWLRAQYDDDERVARDADVKQGDPEWFVSPVLAAPGNFTIRSKRDMRPIARVQHLDGDEDEPVILDGAAAAEHIARHDPARVLRDVDAKRRILDAYRAAFDRRARHPEDLASAGALLEALRIVKLLALPYADRSGYRPEWQPGAR